MASSLIRISEATTLELQALKGIGPKRASYIAAYRSDVAAIRNNFDLATVTGLSLDGAAQLTGQIDWRTNDRRGKINIWPVTFTGLACLWLIYASFEQIIDEPFVTPGSYYNISLLLILLGSFAAASDITIASFRNRSSETTWFFSIATSLLGIGLISLTVLMISGLIIDLTSDFTQTLNSTAGLVLYSLIIVWLMYGPALCLRTFIGEQGGIGSAIVVYDGGLAAIPLLCAITLTFFNSNLWIEEIFSAWRFTIVVVNAADLVKGNSAFIAMLSKLDQGRLRFIYSRRIEEPIKVSLSIIFGWMSFASAAILLAVATVRLP